MITQEESYANNARIGLRLKRPTFMFKDRMNELECCYCLEHVYHTWCCDCLTPEQAEEYVKEMEKK
jgi:hypothetical protein